MAAAHKLVGFAAIVGVVFGVAFGAGRLWEPTQPVAAGHDSTEASSVAEPAVADTLPGGLSVAEAGYRLQLSDTRLSTGSEAPLRFRILGPDGQPVTHYVDKHDKPLHLIVVTRDLTTYAHLHPTRDRAGQWSTTADLSRPGVYRVFADFTPVGGPALTLGADVYVPGRYVPQPLPAPNSTATVDGYTVTLAGESQAGTETTVTLNVTRNGRPVTDLQTYLGAHGHLVTLRDGDLGYLHNHPLHEPPDPGAPAGPTVKFGTTFPSPGEYRLFFDFQHRDTVRTAAFTVTVTGFEATLAANPPASSTSDTGHGH